MHKTARHYCRLKEISLEQLVEYCLGFFACAAVIVFCGTKLSYYGDRIADLTGMGKAWIGFILMALVTSLPELINGISSVVIVKAPDLAAGDIFGGCMLNLLMFSLLDARVKKPLFSIVKSSHIIAALFGIIMFIICGIAIYNSSEIPSVFQVSCSSLVLFGVYLTAVRCIFKYEQNASTRPSDGAVAPAASGDAELRKVAVRYFLNAVIVIGAALFLPFFGEHIATKAGLGNSFFATLFIAAATSLPELVVSLSALKIGSLDLAVGNILGSNVFNICLLGIIDIFYRGGSLFTAITTTHLLTIFIIAIMTAVAGLGIFLKMEKKKFGLLNIDTFMLVVLYMIPVVYLFHKK